MTETAVAISGPERDRGDAARLGRPGDDRDGAAHRRSRVGRGRRRGEIQVRGPQVMLGYKNRPDETAAILDADGWLRTGDLGRVDADGNVYVVDRLKELIKVDAHQVAPAEREALLLTHPGVADAAVVGRPDPCHGEVPVAVVVPAGTLDPGELAAWVAGEVAPWKRIRAVVVADEIPRTPAGKVLRRTLSDRFEAPGS